MKKQRILITVKTYPTLSRTYGETVCTAGITEDGKWIRLYPVPFRRLDDENQYKRFDWIECELIRGTKDPRPETHHPADPSELPVVEHVGTSEQWKVRRELILGKTEVYTNRDEIVSRAKDKSVAMSLATFKPTKIIDFVHEEEDERVWNEDSMRKMRQLTDQGELFDESWRQTFKVIPKLPYRFYYRFEDDEGASSRMRVLDWELGQLYWNCLRRHRSEKVALEKVRQKYFDEFIKSDLHFFLGTTQNHHFTAKNPWLIIGVFQIPHAPPEVQMDLL